MLSPEEAAGRSSARRSAADSEGGEREERPFSLTVRSPTGAGGPGRKELRTDAARGSVCSRRTLIGCEKVKLKPR